ncbi:Cyclohexanecarboxylate-CoA ligase [Georgfuchsia toluolica]|uniref:Cyclohexanecarboxylate-CoA ligase n=1 Tax=Georgfuchsia toluolica TaxID=424218 RepID=A0A916J1L0_9PROT|nr:AMP-binding protein [Georgfuchsia toluolica]CAG4882312.1 Cyclohexanecarboxylate-CoA ligase [Georgfuchsia toluolica]
MKDVFLGPERLELERHRGVWPDLVISEYFDRWVVEKPEATAIVAFREEDGTTTRLSWRQLGAMVSRIAAGLAMRGVAKGDVVSFQLPNWWQFVAVHLACVRIGAISNPLMPIFRMREMSFMVKHAETKVLIVPQRFRGFDHANLARELQELLPTLRHVIVIDGERDDAFEVAFGQINDPPANDMTAGTALKPNDVMQLLFTSGTTGEPKGVLHTSNTLNGVIMQFIQRMQLNGDDILFMPSPLAHQVGFSYGLTVAMILGAPLVLLDVWNVARAVDLIEAHGPTYIFAATPFLADLANFPDIEKRRLDALRLFVSSGAPIPPVVVKRAEQKLNAKVISSWGMTECCSATQTLLSDHKAHDSDGCALPGVEVRIAAADGKEAPRGEPGSLQFRGASLFVGYLKRPHLYALDEEGWFDSGDIASMDEEGYIRICGRNKDIIIRGGENIPVVEVESAIYKMPQITDVAIVAIPDPRIQERACAFITLRPGQRLSLDDIKSHLASEGLSKHFWPERLEIIEEMPRTPTGKIQKFVLRELAKELAAA